MVVPLLLYCHYDTIKTPVTPDPRSDEPLPVSVATGTVS